MPPIPGTPLGHNFRRDRMMRRILGGASIFTLIMTIPQVLTIWIGHRAGGVSLFSWSAYLATAVLWFLHGVRRGDKNIYLPCIGWITLDAAVIVGVLLYG